MFHLHIYIVFLPVEPCTCIANQFKICLKVDPEYLLDDQSIANRPHCVSHGGASGTWPTSTSLFSLH